MSKSKSRLALTPGEPAGIGPDIALSSFQTASQLAQIVYVADPAMLKQRADHLGLNIDFNVIEQSQLKANALNVFPVLLQSTCKPGQLNPDNGPYVLQCLEQAVKLWETEQVEALVTGPVHKANITQSGTPFSGHTEWLAERTGAEQVVMMLTGGELRVALATTHLPLNEVPAAITHERLTTTLLIVHKELKQRFQIAQPTIGVCGLNPHAGESGQLGKEEIEVIRPVIDNLTAEGMKLIGPLPADTIFAPDIANQFDLILAMYHDQGLAPLKQVHFYDAVNITLGMPLIRTSVDHGTAIELSGSGKADDRSLLAAIRVATELAQA